jgi:hypothetical protein
MPVSYSNGVANQRLQMFADAVDKLTFAPSTGVRQAGQLVIGTTSLNGGPAGVLATLALPTPAFTVAARVATLQGVPLQTSAIAAGVAAKAEIRDNAGNVIVSGLTVGTAAADIIIGSVNLALDETVIVTGGTVTHP